ncbi:hypothetical protein [Actinoallomurus acanthiterrae]
MHVYVVHAVTDRSFAGSPAGVCLLSEPADAEMVGYQAFGRGGEVRVSARGDRVTLCGAVVTLIEGSLST